MSTFSAYGMGPKGFLVDRPLNDYERENQLGIKRAASTELHYDLSLIRLNSTFVECVDKWYSMRGFVAMIGGVYASILLVGIGFVLYAFFSSRYLGFLIPLLVGGVALWLPVRGLLSDAFTYTHYPLRLNRKNRQIYAFRRDGTVLKAGWDELYWTIYNTKPGPGGGDLNVMGHLLEEDGVTVKESVALSMVSAGLHGQAKLKTFFEFFRRYMEDGPGPVLDALKPDPLITLPGIDKQRETWLFGWKHITGNAAGLPLVQVLFQPFFFPISLFRWLVMRTSKIPQWPQWVEDECRVEPNDAWVRDERHAAS